VRDPDDRDTVGDELARQTLEYRRSLPVERRRRLVHEQHPRLGCQRTRQTRALRLAARQLAGVAVEELASQRRAFEQLGERVVVLVRWLCLAQVVAYGAGERHRALEDHRDLAAQLERVSRCDVLAAVAYAALARHLEAVAQAQQRRLAGARRTGDDGQAVG
jgi:hypothetical protein